MIYLDNAATSYPKPQAVISEVSRCLRKYCGNPGRGSHKISMQAAEAIYCARERVASLIGVSKPENIVFCHNATTGLNIAIKGAYRNNCHVITSDIEHNSVLRPIFSSIQSRGGDISFFDSSESPEAAIPALVRPETSMIVSTIASNVNGKIIDLKSLSKVASLYGIPLIIDASQYLGHNKIDLKDVYYSAVCSAGHKSLFGIQGAAFIAFSDDFLPTTLIEGGSGIESFAQNMPERIPERYEAGTLSTPAIVSLSTGIEFLSKVGIDRITARLSALDARWLEALENLPSVKSYGVENGTAAFNVRDFPSSAVAEHLAKNGIAARAGFHCAPTAHKKLGTEQTGAVRISFSYFNKPREIDTLYSVLKKM